MVSIASFIIPTLFWLTPLAACILVVPVLCKSVVVPIPRSSLLTHIFLALLIRPFLYLAANIWLLLPVSYIVAAAPAFAIAFAGWTVQFFVLTIVENAIASWPELNPLDVKKNVKESVGQLISSLDTFLRNTNFTEVFQGVRHLSGSSWAENRHDSDAFQNYNFTAVLRNLTISESTQQSIEVINTAVINLLADVEVSNIFNTSRIPPDFSGPFETISEALNDLAKHLNFTEVLRDGNVSSELLGSLKTLEDALVDARESFNLTELQEAIISSGAAEETLQQLYSLPPSFKSLLKPAETTSWVEAIRKCVASIPLQFRITTGIYILLLVLGIPVLLFLRAAMQDGCLWLVTRRYESNIPSAQRSASGWMFVAATSGSALAVAETLPYCCFYFYLYISDILPAGTSFVLLVHTLAAAPVRAASQMRIAEAAARRDVLKDVKPGFISGLVRAALSNTIFNVWWMIFSGVLVVSIVTMWVPVVFVSTDAFVATIAVLWGRRICHRLLMDERRMVEDHERKRD